MSKTLVVYPNLDAARCTALQEIAERTHGRVVFCDNESEALRAIPQAEGFYGKLTPSILSAAQKLQWVQSPTASLEHYLFPELIQHPCILTNMRGLFSDVVADHVLAMILCFARRLHIYIRQQTQHRWAPLGEPQFRTDFVHSPGRVTPVDLAHQHLSDLVLGVFGVGHIGGEVCRRGLSLGMQVCGIDIHPAKKVAEGCEIWPLSKLGELLSLADYLVIAAPHTPQTEGLFNRDLLQLMKPSAVLINVGRGAIVRLNDLTEALRTKVIGGAALDVCDPEPLPADHPLWDFPNVIITPHVAAASPRIAERHFKMLSENVRRFFNNQPLLNVVDKSQWC
ncbi:MAG: putative NAD-binding protein (D-isomer specific 2-hydroxyacid dehydrogenase?) [Planctomycetaceae bacterium]|nr:MAG: putative NAD-binding protein (D-isomer specific 2-hydroxyacid dehydrogenase?) [Planctomycetaceae bacterium]